MTKLDDDAKRIETQTQWPRMTVRAVIRLLIYYHCLHLIMVLLMKMALLFSYSQEKSSFGFILVMDTGMQQLNLYVVYLSLIL